MTWLIGYFARLLFVASVFAVGIWCARNRAECFGRKSFVLYYLARVMLMCMLVCWLNSIPSDIPGWMDHAHWMIYDNLVPGKGFLTPYALGFNYLLVLAVKVYDSPFSIVLLFELVEMAAMWIMYDAFKRLSGEVVAKKVTILFLTSPITLYCLWLGAQDEVIILLFLAFVFWLTVTRRSIWWMPVASFCGFLFTKILLVFFLQPLYCYRKFKSAFLCFAGLAAYVILVKTLGIDPLNMVFGRVPGINGSGDELTSIYTLGNIWFLFRSIPQAAQIAVFLLLLGVVSLGPAIKLLDVSSYDNDGAIELCLNLLCRWGMVFTMFYRMSFATYCACFLPFLLYIAVRKNRLGWGDVLLLFAWLMAMTGKDSLYYGRLVWSNSESTRQFVFAAYTAAYQVLAVSVFWRFLIDINGCLANKPKLRFLKGDNFANWRT